MSLPSWFAAARSGLFVHWGLYSTRGWEPSWPLVGGFPAFPYCQDVPIDTPEDALDPLLTVIEVTGPCWP